MAAYSAGSSRASSSRLILAAEPQPVFDDDRAGTREAPDIAASAGQQADLRPGDVILLGLANAVEDVRALLIVEELRRNFLLYGPQAGNHRVLEIGRPGLPVDEIGHAAVAGWCQIIHDAVAAFRCRRGG